MRKFRFEFLINFDRKFRFEFLINFDILTHLKVSLCRVDLICSSIFSPSHLSDFSFIARLSEIIAQNQDNSSPPQVTNCVSLIREQTVFCNICSQVSNHHGWHTLHSIECEIVAF